MAAIVCVVARCCVAQGSADRATPCAGLLSTQPFPRGERLNVRRSQCLPPADAAQLDLAALAFAFTASIWAFALSLHAF